MQIPLSKPWWEYAKTPVMGESSYYDSNWAETGIAIKCLAEGKTFEKRYHDGSYEIEKEEVLNKVISLGLKLFKVDPSSSGSRKANGDTTDRYFVDENSSLFLSLGKADSDKDITVVLVSLNNDTISKFDDMMDKIIKPKVSSGKAYVLAQSEHGIKLTSVGLASVPFEEGNYLKSVVDDFDHVINDMNSLNPCGRVILLDGEPGVGKSYLIKSMLGKVPNALFIIVPSHMIASLANPEIIPVLIRYKNDAGPIVLIAEDADECLSSRAADNISSISSLLNLSDGILGTLLDIRIVCTTNVDIKDVDEAVVRDGRLCKRIDVGQLGHEQANVIYSRLTEKKGIFTKGGYTLASIYKAAKEGGWKPASIKRQVGFSANPVAYISDMIDFDGDY